MLKIEIPAGTICEACESRDDGVTYNEATTYNDHYGWMPPTFYCQSCVDKMEASYEGPTEMDVVVPTVVMDEHGRIY